MKICEECNSLVVKGNCTNKRCRNHIKSSVEPATYNQIEYLKVLYERTGQEPPPYDSLSKKEASLLIEALELI